MGSEIQSERAKQAQELRDLQESYRKRRKAVVDGGEAELQKARQETTAKVSEESGSGEATVNHLRKTNQEKIADTKLSGEQQLRYEKKALAKQLENTKQSAALQVEQLEQNTNVKQTTLQKSMGELTKKETELRVRENAITNNIQKEQSQRREQIHKAAETQIAEIDTRASQKKDEIREKTDKELQAEIQNSKKALKQQRDGFQNTYQKQGEMTKAQMLAQKEQHAKMTEAQRLEYNESIARQKNAAGQALQKETVEGQGRIMELQSENQKVYENERNKGHEQMEKTRQHYATEIARTHKNGDAEVFNQTEKHAQLMNKLKLEGKTEVELLQTEHETKLKDREIENKKAAEKHDLYFKQALVQQKGEYDDAFKKNLKAFSDQVRLQKAQYMDSAVKEKREVMKDIGKYADKKADPFYNMTRAKSKLEETDTHYIVKADVPEHERQNVKFSVKQDKVIVNGQRRFEDKIEDEASKVSTNSYQTFREIIPLEHPVREKLIDQRWEDGILTLKIPKA